MSRLRPLAPTLALLLACELESRVIDPFPVTVDLSFGPVLAAASTDEGPAVQVVVDVLSPITVLDPFQPDRALPAPRRRRLTLTLHGVDPELGPTVPRVRYPGTAAFEMHPCARDGLCRVGIGDALTEIAGVIGYDLLSRSAVRFDFPDRVMRFFPDLPGDDVSRGLACDAIFPAAYGGGGTLLIAGSEVNFDGLRPAVGACLDAAGADRDRPGGTDALFALSTANGPTILSASSYDRYARATGAPRRDLLPAAELHLPAGPIAARLAEVEYAALVGEASEERGPCQEVFANRVMSDDRCIETQEGAFVVPEGGLPDPADPIDPDAPPLQLQRCPCPDNETFCRTAAVIELAAPIVVAVVDDHLPLLQGLRDELRPARPEVDGVLGTQAMASLRLDLDYPNNRLAMRCLETEACTTRPEIRSRATLARLAACREAR